MILMDSTGFPLSDTGSGNKLPLSEMTMARISSECQQVRHLLHADPGYRMIQEKDLRRQHVMYVVQSKKNGYITIMMSSVFSSKRNHLYDAQYNLGHKTCI